MGLRITQPGILTTVQDAGRFGYQPAGFSPSGPMDAKALYLANILVNNPPEYAALEMAIQGVTAEFDRKTWFALTGADMGATLNGAPVERYRAYEVKAGDVLRCGVARRGKYAYLAVAGGIDVPRVLGSRSTNLRCGIGGFRGRKVKFGDELPLRVTGVFLDNHYRKHLPPPELPGDRVELRAVPGPQDGYFTEQGLKTFTSTAYTVLPESDRMGVRLSGAAVEAKAGVDILSDAIVFGSVQIPPSGQPIVLMADRQTTGGYAKVATVISPDLPRLAQCGPGTELRFRFVSVEEANKLRRQYEKELRKCAQKTGFCPEKW